MGLVHAVAPLLAVILVCTRREAEIVFDAWSAQRIVMATKKTAAAKTTSKATTPAKAATPKAKTKAAAKPSKAPAPVVEAVAAGDENKPAGVRGAAPWAARHAAKHAAEARARAALPALPGSARATIRTPDGAEDIKKKISELHNAATQIKALRKSLQKSFFDIGVVLKDIRDRKLYVAKGFGTFEAYLERETDLGRVTCLRLVKLVTTFQREAALEIGMDKVFAALSTIEMDAMPESRGSSRMLPPPVSTSVLPLKPPGR